MWHGLVSGLLSTLSSASGLTIVVLGSLAGIIGGFLPGLSAPGALALLLPLTFKMSPAHGVVFLVAAYTGAQYGGSMTATVLNTPGAPESAVMTLDGFALTKLGRGREALQGALWAGLIGGLAGVLVLVALVGPVSTLGPKFGPPEYTALATLGFTVAATASRGSGVKGIASIAFGVLLSTVGIDHISGVQRLTFGFPSLFGGFQLIPVLIGLFAVSEAVYLLTSPGSMGSRVPQRNDRFRARSLGKHGGAIGVGSVVGLLIGVLPGGGAALASFLGYSGARAVSPERDQFGRGAIDGLLGPEAADKAIVGAALIPLLALGVPSTASAGILLGGLEVHNLVPGPGFVSGNGKLVYSLLAGALLANVAVFAVGRVMVGPVTRLRTLNGPALGLIILCISLIASYAYNSVAFSIWVTGCMGLMGYLMRRGGFPLAPVIFGVLLGPIFEDNLRRTLTASGNSILPLLTHPVSAGLLALAVVVAALGLIGGWRDARKKGMPPEDVAAKGGTGGANVPVPQT